MPSRREESVLDEDVSVTQTQEIDQQPQEEEESVCYTDLDWFLILY